MYTDNTEDSLVILNTTKLKDNLKMAIVNIMSICGNYDLFHIPFVVIWDD